MLGLELGFTIRVRVRPRVGFGTRISAGVCV